LQRYCVGDKPNAFYPISWTWRSGDWVFSEIAAAPATTVRRLRRQMPNPTLDIIDVMVIIRRDNLKYGFYERRAENR
jgi:hypothetical protein